MPLIYFDGFEIKYFLWHNDCYVDICQSEILNLIVYYVQFYRMYTFVTTRFFILEQVFFLTELIEVNELFIRKKKIYPYTAIILA